MATKSRYDQEEETKSIKDSPKGAPTGEIQPGCADAEQKESVSVAKNKPEKPKEGEQ